MWVPTHAGRWLAVVTFQIPYADGRAPLQAHDRLVPYCALEKREPPDAGRGGR